MNYIIFDLEATCGWQNENRQSEIIEIGAVKLNDKLEVVDEFQSFIRPILNPELTPFCMELTSITQEDVYYADKFPMVWNRFAHWITDGMQKDGPDYRLCSWGHYDKNQLCDDLKLHDFHLAIKPVRDKHISIKHQHGQMLARAHQEKYGMATGRTKQLSKGVGMMKALDMLGIEPTGTHHRGIDDARNIAKIFAHPSVFPNLKF